MRDFEMKLNEFYLHRNFRGIVAYLLGALLILLVAAGSKFEDKDKKKGLVTYTDGRVKKRPINKQDWITAAKDTTVLRGDRVRTYQRSRAELELLDLDVIRMAPETIIDIVKLYEETKEKIDAVGNVPHVHASGRKNNSIQNRPTGYQIR